MCQNFSDKEFIDFPIKKSEDQEFTPPLTDDR
jgi:hypothetical protein